MNHSFFFAGCCSNSGSGSGTNGGTDQSAFAAAG